MKTTLNLIPLLENCPKGTKLYSTVLGEVEFEGINDIIGPIIVTTDTGNAECFTADGKMYNYYNGECLLFPSKEQRDWSKFKPNNSKFDPKTFKTFDKVLVKLDGCVWFADFISRPMSNNIIYTMSTVNADMVIPYNEETKHLAGTNEKAPKYYRYWEK